jgi:crossover junction endodeoxyribonuclease RusA
MLPGRLGLWLELYPPDRRVRDIDNPLKALLDALRAAGMFADDRQIKRLLIELFDGGASEGVVVARLYQLEDQRAYEAWHPAVRR